MVRDGIAIVDNFLTNEQFSFLEYSILGEGNENVKWNFRDFTVNICKEEIENKDSYQFTNLIFYKNRIFNEEIFDNLIPLFEKRLEVEHWLKIKLNFRPIGKKIETGFHNDLLHEDGFMFLTAVFYLNDNNGYTEIINKKSESIKVESKKNRCVIFRGDLFHQAVTADDDHRIILNMNFLNKEVINFYKS